MNGISRSKWASTRKSNQESNGTAKAVPLHKSKTTNRTPSSLTDLLYGDGEQLCAADYVVQWRGRGFVHVGFAADDHFLVAAHAVHHVHYRDGQRGHDLIGDAGFRVGFQQGNVEAIIGVLFVEQSDRGGEVELAAEGLVGPAYAVERFAVA